MPHEKPEFFWYNPVSGESTWESPFPTPHMDDEGNTFLVDPANHENTWWEQDPPEEWAWEAAEATEGDNAGSTYYHNKVSSRVRSSGICSATQSRAEHARVSTWGDRDSASPCHLFWEGLGSNRAPSWRQSFGMGG